MFLTDLCFMDYILVLNNIRNSQLPKLVSSGKPSILKYEYWKSHLPLAVYCRLWWLHEHRAPGHLLASHHSPFLHWHAWQLHIYRVCYPTKLWDTTTIYQLQVIVSSSQSLCLCSLYSATAFASNSISSPSSLSRDKSLLYWIALSFQLLKPDRQPWFLLGCCCSSLHPLQLPVPVI